MKPKIFFLYVFLVSSLIVNAQNVALNFDGSDDYVEASNVNVTGNNVTIEAWIKADTWQLNAWQGTIVGTDSWSLNQQTGFALRCGQNGQLSFVVSNLFSWEEAISASIMQTGKWYHVAGVCDGNTLKCYINGKLVAMRSYQNLTISNTSIKMRIGGNLIEPRFFDGAIDEVRIWNTAKNNCEIIENMNKEFTGTEPELLAYYNFNQGVAEGNNSINTTLSDITPNNHDGTLNNFALNGITSNWVLSFDTSKTPIVSTGDTSAITSRKATLKATLSSIGGTDVIKRGFYCYTSDFCIPENPISIDTSSLFSQGNYSLTISGLLQNTTYYYRAFATNSNGTSYGAIKSFKTLPNNAPQAQNDNISINEDSLIYITDIILANDKDADEQTLIYRDNVEISFEQYPINGSFEWIENTNSFKLAYRPNQNFNGSDTIKYQLFDNLFASSNVATVVINIAPVNDAPTANNDFISTQEDFLAVFDVLNNDNDIEGNLDSTSVSIVTNAGNGNAIKNNDGIFTYTPNADFNGNDTFIYKVCDISGDCSTATVVIMISPLNDAPTANNDTLTINEDQIITTLVITNDTDVDGLNDINPLSVSVSVNPTNGSINSIVNGNITYVPKANFSGTDSYQYRVCDQFGLCATAKVMVNVSPINDPPSLTDDVNDKVISNNKSIAINVFSNDKDVDSKTGNDDIDKTSLQIIVQPQNGKIDSIGSTNSRLVYYRPNKQFLGTDQFTYTAHDKAGESDTATVTLTVNKTQWTVMVYIDSDNNHVEQVEDIIKNISTAKGRTGQMSSASFVILTNYSMDINTTTDTVYQYYATSLKSIVEDTLGEINMGVRETLTEFINNSIINYPANEYALYLFHEGGISYDENSLEKNNNNPFLNRQLPDASLEHPIWLPEQFLNANTDKYNDSFHDFLSTEEINMAIDSSKLDSLDILFIERPYMASIENIHTIKKVKTLFASEAKSSYNMAHIADNFSYAFPDKIVEKYNDDLSLWQKDISMSEMKMQNIDSLIRLLDTMLNTFQQEDTSFWRQTQAIYNDITKYNHLVDLLYFFSRLKDSVGASVPNFEQAYQDLYDYASITIKAASGSQYVNQDGDSTLLGLGISFDITPEFYNEFYDHSLWDEFVTKMLSVTDPGEPNNIWSNAGGSINNGTINGQLSNEDIFDMFLITNSKVSEISLCLYKNDTTEICMEDADTDLTIGLFSIEGDRIWMFDENTQIEGSLPSGAYYIAVYSKGTIAAPKSYTLHIAGFSVEPADYKLTLANDDAFMEEDIAYSTSSGAYANQYTLPQKNATLLKIWYFVYANAYDCDDSNPKPLINVFAAPLSGKKVEEPLNKLIDTTVTPSTSWACNPSGWNYVDVSSKKVRLDSNFVVGIAWNEDPTEDEFPWIGVIEKGYPSSYELDSSNIQNGWIKTGYTLKIRAEVQYFNTLLGKYETRIIEPDQFKSYPNPTTDEVNLSFNLKQRANAIITITDLQGRIVYNETRKNMPQGNQTLSIELPANLTQGIYVLTLSTPYQRYTTKIIKQ